MRILRRNLDENKIEISVKNSADETIFRKEYTKSEVEAFLDGFKILSNTLFSFVDQLPVEAEII